MPGQKISALTPVSDLQSADQIPLARAGSTYKITGDKFASKIQLDAVSAYGDNAFALKTTVSEMSATVDSKFALKTTVTGMSAYADNIFALKTTVTGMSAYADTKFIPNPMPATAYQVLTLNSTNTWVASAVPTELPSGSPYQIVTRSTTNTWVASAAPIVPVAVPSGCVMMWTSSTLPAGWIECNGQSTASYPNLAAVCGANVPDLRGEFVRGWDNGKGTDSGRALKSTQDDALESHSHMLPSSDASKAVSPYGWADGQPSKTCEDFTNAVTSTSRHITSSTGGTETRPRNVALMYIIKT